MEERFLPIGIQDFEKLRKGGYVYVDKTDYSPLKNLLPSQMSECKKLRLLLVQERQTL